MQEERTNAGTGTERRSSVQPGCLYVVATPIGNLDDISSRALAVLQAVDLVLAEDTRRTKNLLQHYSISAPMLSFHKFNERGRAREVIERMLEERISVAIVSDAGTPCISDPGVEIVRLARESGIPVYGVSGPSAIITAVSVSGLPSSEFTFVGFLPRAPGDLRKALRRLRERGISTFVAYESPKRVKGLAAAMLEELPEAQVCFCCELTKMFERSYYGPISEVVGALEADSNAELGEYTVVAHIRHEERSAASPLSIEARLVQVMLERGCTLKEAAASVVRETGKPRREVYQAYLRLKSMFGPHVERE